MTMRALLFAGLISLLAFAAGCDLFGGGGPEEARLRLEGNDGSTVRLILTQQFAAQRQPRYEPVSGAQIGDTLLVVILEADTTEVTLPFEQTVDISGTQQIYARILRTDPRNDNLQGRLWIDGRLRADQRPTALQDSIFFLYNFVSSGRDPIVEF